MSYLLAGSGLFFWLVVYAAAYRGKRQTIQDPVIAHILFTSLGCIVAGAGLLLVAWSLHDLTLPLQESILGIAGSAGAFLGMGTAAVPIWWYLPHIAAHPVAADVQAERAERHMLEAEVRQLRAELHQARRDYSLARLQEFRTLCAQEERAAEQSYAHGAH